MSRNILILNGSPRARGNTSALIQAFTEGAESAGHTVTCFHLQKMNIHPCIGCLRAGLDPNSPCSQKDDMDQIYPVFQKADLVVLASPLYYWGFTAQLQAAFHRLFALAERNPNYALPKKDCVLLMAAAGTAFDDILRWYDRLTSRGWTDKGRILCSCGMNVGDIAGHPKLDEARELGRSL